MANLYLKFTNRYLLILEEMLITFSKKYLGTHNLIEDDNKCAIPYISHTAGFAKLLIIFLKCRKNDFLLGVLYDVLDAIDRNFPKEFGYYNGIAGISDTLLDAYKYTQNIKYFESVKRKVQIIMTFHKEKRKGFLSGDEGINYFYYKLSKYIGSEKNEKSIN